MHRDFYLTITEREEAPKTCSYLSDQYSGKTQDLCLSISAQAFFSSILTSGILDLATGSGSALSTRSELQNTRRILNNA